MVECGTKERGERREGKEMESVGVLCSPVIVIAIFSEQATNYVMTFNGYNCIAVCLHGA